MVPAPHPPHLEIAASAAGRIGQTEIAYPCLPSADDGGGALELEIAVSAELDERRVDEASLPTSTAKTTSRHPHSADGSG